MDLVETIEEVDEMPLGDVTALMTNQEDFQAFLETIQQHADNEQLFLDEAFVMGLGWNIGAANNNEVRDIEEVIDETLEMATEWEGDLSVENTVTIPERATSSGINVEDTRVEDRVAIGIFPMSDVNSLEIQHASNQTEESSLSSRSM